MCIFFSFSIKYVGLPTDIESYAGFFTNNTTFDNNMFFWYFPAQNKDADAPLLIWLQGGPGGGSTFGLFNEVGPFIIDEKLNLLKRTEGNWNAKYSMLFIDNPVGAGFSYTGVGDAGYTTNEVEVVCTFFLLFFFFFFFYISILFLYYLDLGVSRI